MGKKFNIPILYITQAIGIALGIQPNSLGLQRHFVPVRLEGKSKIQHNAPTPAAAVSKRTEFIDVTNRSIHLPLRREHQRNGGLCESSKTMERVRGNQP